MLKERELSAGYLGSIRRNLTEQHGPLQDPLRLVGLPARATVNLPHLPGPRDYLRELLAAGALGQPRGRLRNHAVGIARVGIAPCGLRAGAGVLQIAA